MASYTVHHIYKQIFKIWRVRRFKVFLERIDPQREERILDVGGYPGNWSGHTDVRWAGVDTLNVDPVDWDPTSAGGQGIRAMVGDGCQLLQMADGSYDIVFSNSVIEHVGDWERQQAFAREVRRVGRKLWLQTPAWECPIEPHYLAPFIHWLPKAIQRRVIRWATVWGVVQRPSQESIDEMVKTTRLLKKQEIMELFPDCEVIVERLLWILPKSYVVVRTT